MDNNTPAKKKFPWKVVMIILLLLGVTITSVILVRKKKKKDMIAKIIASGTSLTDEVLKSMSYSDLKLLADATGAE